MKIVAISGSTRAASLNTRLLRFVADAARRAGADVREVSLRDAAIPMYDGDLEDAHGVPASAQALREQIGAADVLVIATPEYNASISAVLKNAIDWVSRPESGGPPAQAFRGRPTVLMSASPSPGGGTRALAQLEAIMRAMGADVRESRLSVPRAHETLEKPDEALLARIEALGKELASLQPLAAR